MSATAPYVFNANELWTIWIAGYAAVVSTFVLGWDAYKWLASGVKIDLSVSTNMCFVGGVVEDHKTYISVTALNVGDRPTTITNLGGMYFDSWWRAYITCRKPIKAFIVTQPAPAQRIPYRFEVGDQWIGMVNQEDDFLRMAEEGYLFMILYTAQGQRGQRVRVKAREKKTEAA